jgi:hypothetical protein
LTEDQARAQIETKGYTNVSRLRKDARGVWHGKAEKDGIAQQVTLDVRGNVSSQ